MPKAMNCITTLAVALLMGGLIPVSAIEPGESQTLTSSEQVPKGLSAADWQSIRSTYAASVTSQPAYVKASNTEAEDEFGRSVAVSGDTVVVGAQRENSNAVGVNGNQADNSARDSGAVYVFVRSSGGWIQQAYLKASNARGGSKFGQSVAISGDTIVVAAPREGLLDALNANADQGNGPIGIGAVYVFVRSSGTWSQQAYLKSSGSAGLGDSLAISGDTVVAGARGDASNAVGVNSRRPANSKAVNSGAAYIFVRNAGAWSQQAYLKASNTGKFDEFGGSVAVSGDTVVVGACNEESNAMGVNGNQVDNSAFLNGAAYVFVRSNGTWSQQAYLKASNRSENFGCSVAVSGDTVVVGAIGENGNAVGVNGNQSDYGAAISGAAYVFVRRSGKWSQQAYLKASNTGTLDQFGSSVATSGDTIVVGAFQESSNAVGVNGNQANNRASASGAAYVFVRRSGTWRQQAYLKASNTGADDYFGSSVAVSGDTVVAGASEEDSSSIGINSISNDAGTADGSGAAYIFTLPAVLKYRVKVEDENSKFGKVTGAGRFTKGSVVTLKAKAKKGHQFVGWYEGKKLISKKKQLTIKKLTANRTITAKFQ
jgi:uncharacterized repeat protein (TIGR02543 family)